MNTISNAVKRCLILYFCFIVTSNKKGACTAAGARMIHMLFQALSGAFTDSPGQPFFFFVYSESVAVPFLAEADGLHCEWGQDQYRFAGIRPGSPANTPARAASDIPYTANSWYKP